MRVLLATTCTPDDRKTLCAARALARRGVRVSVGSDRFWGLACWSGAVTRRLRYGHPGRDAAAFARVLGRLLAAHPHDVVLPMNDYTTVAIAARPEGASPPAHVALPPLDSLERAQDKLATATLGCELGIECPATRLARTEPELGDAARAVGWPCVVKLRRGSGAVGLRFLSGPGSWQPNEPGPEPSDLAFDRGQWVVQELVPGDTHDVCVVCSHGELRAAVTQRRIRTYPAAGGVGIDCVTTDEPGLVERAAALMRALRWHGPAQIEFKVDPASRGVWLIEINGRLWGTLALSVRAGVDVPWLLFRLALDGDVEPERAYRVGARYRWTIPLGLLHAAQSEEPWRSLWSFLGPSRDTGGDWRWRDPGPHLAEGVYAIRRMWSRRRLGPERRAAGMAGSR